MVRLKAPPVEGAANEALVALPGKDTRRRPLRRARGERGHGAQQGRQRGRARRGRGAGAPRGMIAADFAVRRIGLLATLAGPAPRTGAAMRDLGLAARRRDRRRRRADRLGGPRRPTRRGGRPSAGSARPSIAGGRRRRARPRRRAHPPRLRRRPRRRDPAAPGRGDLPGDRGRGRRDRAHGRGDASGLRRGARGPRRLAPRRDAAVRHHDGRGEERLRPRDRGRDPRASRPSARPPRATPSPSCRRSSAPTRCRGSTGGTAERYVRAPRRRDDPGGRASVASPPSPTSSASRASSRSRRAGASCSPPGRVA